MILDQELIEDCLWKCPSCGELSEASFEDCGIGPYEIHGTPGNHVDYQFVTVCCGSYVDPYDGIAIEDD